MDVPVAQEIVKHPAWRAARRNPNAMLLAVQLLSVIVFAFVDGDSSALGRSLFSLVGLVVLGMAIRAVDASPMANWVGIVLLIPCVVLTVLDGALGWTQPVHMVSDVFHLLFYVYTAVSLIAYMFRDERVTRDEMFAVGACFTVALWAFAYAYSIVDGIYPGAFIAATPGEHRTWIEFLFLSSTNMTSTGLSDVVPVVPLARSVVVLQQISGVLYIAMVISSLVAMSLRRGAGSKA